MQPTQAQLSNHVLNTGDLITSLQRREKTATGSMQGQMEPVHCGASPVSTLWRDQIQSAWSCLVKSPESQGWDRVTRSTSCSRSSPSIVETLRMPRETSEKERWVKKIAQSLGSEVGTRGKPKTRSTTMGRAIWLIDYRGAV